MSYASAHDLPSFVELSNQLKGMKLLAVFSPGLRDAIKRTEAGLTELGDLVDRFYRVLGERHWIYHDLLSVEKVRQLLDGSTDPEELERGLIALYNADFIRLGIQLSMKFEAAAKRRALLDRALADYLDGRFYSCIFLLLAVADGFVNDLESVRRGLHTRTEEELGAWDSVISHHRGIGHVTRSVIFKSVGKTKTEPVYELYRHGIMHGMVVDFDNIVVATKAWNLYFSVIDWATAKQKAAEPAPPTSTVREVAHQALENQRNRKLLEAWAPYAVQAGDDGFAEDDAYLACTDFLKLWERGNMGGMTSYLSRQIAGNRGNALPALIRKRYGSYRLEKFDVTAIRHTAAAACEVCVNIKIEGQPEQPVELRWLYEGDGPELAMLPKGNGQWKLNVWGPATFLMPRRVG